jgi:hypothetical protein
MDLVAALIETGTVSLDTVAALFARAGGAMDEEDPTASTLDLAGFGVFLDLLSPLAGDLESSVGGDGSRATSAKARLMPATTNAVRTAEPVEEMTAAAVSRTLPRPC